MFLMFPSMISHHSVNFHQANSHTQTDVIKRIKDVLKVSTRMSKLRFFGALEVWLDAF